MNYLLQLSFQNFGEGRLAEVPPRRGSHTLIRAGLKASRRQRRAPGGRSMQDLAGELPRITLLGTWVNKEKKEGRGCYAGAFYYSSYKPLFPSTSTQIRPPYPAPLPSRAMPKRRKKR
jgi:hypothetical protein